MDKSSVEKKAKKTLNNATVDRGEEGYFTKAIEQQTEKIPSGFFLAAGMGAIGLSLAFKAMGQDKTANFIGLWTPTILVLGLYNKLVKLEGSERDDDKDSMH